MVKTMSEKTRTFKQYRNIDLFIWLIILCVFETIVFKAGSRWFASQPYSISVVPAIVSIVLMRWGAFGVLYSILGAIVTVFLAKGSMPVYAVYICGNMFCALSLLILASGKEKVRNSIFLTVAFVLATSFSMLVGRALISLAYEKSFSKALSFVTTDALSAVFAVVVILVVRKLDGVFEDQKHYLIRINSEEEKGVLA